MNWRSDGQDYTRTFEELKIGMTFSLMMFHILKFRKMTHLILMKILNLFFNKKTL